LNKLPLEQQDKLLQTLQTRFEKNPSRHSDLEWVNVQAKLEANPAKLWSLGEMEKSGGEPDVVGYDKETSEYIFYDCSPQTPKGRINICYDGEGQKERAKHGGHPAGNAVDMAATMGIELLNEDQYRALQRHGEFDTKTSSWIKTPDDIRKLDGALFADKRYGHVFVYHNSAPSFYSNRGFRGILRV
jgi:hypothetical protein